MNKYNRVSHIAFNIAIACFILGCMPKYLQVEGSDMIFTIGCCALACAFVIKAFELPKN